MSFVSRGFRGVAATDADSARVPPGQYVTTDFPVLSAGPTPHTPLDQWDFSIAARWTSSGAGPGTSSRRSRARRSPCDIHCVTKWSKLDTLWRGVSIDTLLDGVDTAAEYVDPVLRRRLHDQPAARGRHRRQGVGRLTRTTANRWRPSTAARRACWCRTSTSGRARSGCAACGSRRSTSRASGRPTATTTTATHGRNSGTGATDLAARARSSSVTPETPRVKTHRLRRPRLAGAPRRASTSTFGSRPRTAIRPSAATRSPRRRTARARADRRAPRRRRGLAVPDRRAPRRRQDRAARPGRRLLRLGAFAGRAAAAGRRRVGRRAADGDDPRRAPPRAATSRRGCSSPRAAGTTSSTARSSSALTGGGLAVVHTLTRVAAGGLDGYARRIDAEMLAEVAPGPGERPHVFVCGPTPLVEAVARRSCCSGTSRDAIKTERFGPTGG